MLSSSHASEHLSSLEYRAIGGLSLVFAFRMLGMFMVLPVMTLYGQQLTGATPVLIGLAIGAYGYTQAILQIPLGVLSDKIGRLPIILSGLLIFALGSAVAALSNHIEGVIIGRILQGAGAISAAVMALLSDLTREQHRTKAMAFIGMSIGAAFAVAMVSGPILAYHFGLHGLFWFICFMAIIGFFIMLFVVPRPNQQVIRQDVNITRAHFIPALKDKALLRLNFSIAAVHMVMMANFMALPHVLLDEAGLSKSQHWWVYLTAFTLSAFFMVPLIIYGEKQRKLRQVLIGSVVVLLTCSIFFSFQHQQLWLLVLAITVFFVAFNLIEAILPSMISKVAKAGTKGTAMGIFSSSQFLGAAIGASLGGVLLNMGGLSIVFIGSTLICCIWLVVIANIQEPPYVTSIRLPLPHDCAIDTLTPLLTQQQGITEVSIAEKEQAIYIKLDKKLITPAQIEAIIHSFISANQSPSS